MDRCGSLLWSFIWIVACSLFVGYNVKFRRCAQSGMMFPSKTGGEASVSSTIDSAGKLTENKLTSVMFAVKYWSCCKALGMRAQPIVMFSVVYLSSSIVRRT